MYVYLCMCVHVCVCVCARGMVVTDSSWVFAEYGQSSTDKTEGVCSQNDAFNYHSRMNSPPNAYVNAPPPPTHIPTLRDTTTHHNTHKHTHTHTFSDFTLSLNWHFHVPELITMLSPTALWRLVDSRHGWPLNADERLH